MARRLDEWRRNLAATVEGIRMLSEGHPVPGATSEATPA